MMVGYLSAKLKNSQSSPVNRIPRKKHQKMNGAFHVPTPTHIPARGLLRYSEVRWSVENVYSEFVLFHQVSFSYFSD